MPTCILPCLLQAGQSVLHVMALEANSSGLAEWLLVLDTYGGRALKAQAAALQDKVSAGAEERVFLCAWPSPCTQCSAG